MIRSSKVKKLLKQAVQFVGLSGIGWILDFTTYTLLGLVSDKLFINNIISSLVGVTFVFIFATRKVFQNSSKIPLKWKYFIYVVYQLVLIFLISKLLSFIALFIVENIDIAIVISLSGVIAKILVTPVTMVLNFFVMKGIIEKI